MCGRHELADVRRSMSDARSPGATPGADMHAARACDELGPVDVRRASNSPARHRRTSTVRSRPSLAVLVERVAASALRRSASSLENDADRGSAPHGTRRSTTLEQVDELVALEARASLKSLSRRTTPARQRARRRWRGATAAPGVDPSGRTSAKRAVRRRAVRRAGDQRPASETRSGRRAATAAAY